MFDLFCQRDKYYPGVSFHQVENLKHAAVMCSRPWKAEDVRFVSYGLSSALRQAFVHLCQTQGYQMVHETHRSEFITNICPSWLFDDIWDITKYKGILYLYLKFP